MSGGVDSSFLTYLASKLGLRPLVFHVDAGWNSPEAVNNIRLTSYKTWINALYNSCKLGGNEGSSTLFFKSGVPHIDSPQDHAFCNDVQVRFETQSESIFSREPIPQQNVSKPDFVDVFPIRRPSIKGYPPKVWRQ